MAGLTPAPWRASAQPPFERGLLPAQSCPGGGFGGGRRGLLRLSSSLAGDAPTEEVPDLRIRVAEAGEHLTRVLAEVGRRTRRRLRDARDADRAVDCHEPAEARVVEVDEHAVGAHLRVARHFV